MFKWCVAEVKSIFLIHSAQVRTCSSIHCSCQVVHKRFHLNTFQWNFVDMPIKDITGRYGVLGKEDTIRYLNMFCIIDETGH